jgi:hypothetical protein
MVTSIFAFAGSSRHNSMDVLQAYVLRRRPISGSCWGAVTVPEKAKRAGPKGRPSRTTTCGPHEGSPASWTPLEGSRGMVRQQIDYVKRYGSRRASRRRRLNNRPYEQRRTGIGTPLTRCPPGQPRSYSTPDCAGPPTGARCCSAANGCVHRRAPTDGKWNAACAARHRWGLETAQKGATVSTCAGLFLTNKDARLAMSIKPLALDVIDTLIGIEPHYGVARAVLLRLHISLKHAQLGRRIVCVACRYQSRDKQHPWLFIAHARVAAPEPAWTT